MFRLREPYVAPIRQAGPISSVAGPLDFISRMFTPAIGPFLAKPPPPPQAKTKPLPTATPTEHEPPVWYTHASDALDKTMSGVTYEVAGHKYTLLAEDAFYLDRLIEQLRAWDKQLLMRADAARSSKPFS